MVTINPWPHCQLPYVCVYYFQNNPAGVCLWLTVENITEANYVQVFQNQSQFRFYNGNMKNQPVEKLT